MIATENLIVAVLEKIENELDIKMWNKTQEEYHSPFRNYGTSYKNNVFEVNAYNWGDEGNIKPNFKYKNIEIYWYKYLGRGMEFPEIECDDLCIMLEECLESL